MVIFFIALQTEAADVGAGKEMYTLGEVVVSAKKAGVESVGTTREITAEDIQSRGAETLDEAIRLLPGVSVRVGAQGIPRVDIRGMRSRHVILLLDGVPFNSTFDGQFDPSIITVENIERIKLSYGSHSVLYGSGALGGVINIITKKGRTGLEGTASAEIGEEDSKTGRFTFSGGQNTVDFFLSGNFHETDGFNLSDDFNPTSEEDGDLRENSDRKRNTVFANIGYSPMEDLQIGLVLNYMDGEYGIPPSSINNNADPFANKPKYERVDDMEGLTGNLSGSYDIPGPFEVRGWIYMNEQDEVKNQYDDRTYTTQQDLSINGLYHEENKVTISGGNIQTVYDLPVSGNLSFGLGTKRESYKTKGKRVERRNRPFVPFDDTYKLQTHSAAIEYEGVPFGQIGLVLGYGHHWFEQEDGRDEDKGDFIAGAYYDLFQNTKIRGSVAKKVRFPSIRNLYEKGSENPDLTAEESMNYEVGIDHQLPCDTTISLTGFRLDVEDYIEKDANNIFQNNEEYRFQGFEFSLDTRFIKNLTLRTGYTFMDSKDRSSGTQKDELQYRPRHTLTAEAKYLFGYGISAYMSMEHAKGLYYYSKNAPLIKGKLGDITLVNLKLEKEAVAGRLSIYLGADNLFDNDYEESYGFPQPGMMIYGGVKFRFLPR